MWPLGKKAKLCRAVKNLAIYNDKGIAWAGHSEDQAAQSRATCVSEIQRLVAELGREALPQEFLEGLDHGDLATDISGRFHEILKLHFRG